MYKILDSKTWVKVIGVSSYCCEGRVFCVLRRQSAGSKGISCRIGGFLTNELHGELCELVKRIGFSGPGKPNASGSPVCKTLVICSKSRAMILKGLKYP